MKKFVFHALRIASFLLIPALLHAETLSGVIRNVNYGSHSFGLDVPPVTRVYVTGGTRFETQEGKTNFQAVKEGDKAEVEGRSGGPGVFTATSVKVLGNLAPVKDLASNEVSIELNQSFLFGVNQTAVLKEGGKNSLKLQSTEFINTLCKGGGYDCGGEGEVGMRMKASQGKEENEILLTSKNGRKPTSPVRASLFGYTIQLIEAGEDVVMLVVRKE
ncbi:MAG: hypothetical protein K8R69_05085 [Deltaproteobacteria bacterium]|nr:hypothetical protein [Deltaproteobacteria bacterium]